MKKVILAVFIVIFVSSALFAEVPAKTEYERKLEYKRKKIEVAMRSHLVGRTSGYTNLDTTEFRFTGTPEGFSYGTSSTTGRRDETVSFERVSDWAIIKGGIRELSDLEFLEITGNNKKADSVRAKMDEHRSWSIWGMSAFIGGMVTIVAGSTANPTDSGLITAGSLLTIGGAVINAIMGVSPEHYIHPDFAQEQADKYNIRLKLSLYLPVDYE